MIVRRSAAGHLTHVRGALASLERRGLAEAPLHPLEVAQALGLEVCVDDLPARVMGYATVIDGDWCLVVARALSRAENEWTIAHEVAHALGISRDDHADSFAAELLFSKRWAEFWTTIEAISTSGGFVGGLPELSDRMTQLWVLDRYLLSEEKRKTVRTLAAGVGLVTLIGVAGFSVVKLGEWVAAKVRRSQHDRYRPLESLSPGNARIEDGQNP